MPILVLVAVGLLATLTADDENVVCAHEPDVVTGVRGQALDFVTADPGMFAHACSATVINAPRPFVSGAQGTVALWFKARALSRERSDLLALGAHRDGMIEDCDGIIPVRAEWPGEGFTLAIQPEVAPSFGCVALWGVAGGVDFAVTAPERIDLTAWHHVAFVWRPRSVRLLVDGRTVGSAASGETNDFELTRYLRLASDLYGGSAFSGALDDILVFARALADDEVAALADRHDLGEDPSVTFAMRCDGTTTARVVRRDLADAVAGKAELRAALGAQRFVTVGEPIALRVDLPAGEPAGDLVADIAIHDADGDSVFHASERLTRDAVGAAHAAVIATIARCGIDDLACTVTDAAGATRFARCVRFGVIAKLPPLADIPASSPCGYWSDTSRATLGFKWVRLWDAGCSWAAFEPRKGHYHWDYLDATVDEIRVRGCEPLLCVVGTPAWAAAMPSAELDARPTSVDGYPVDPRIGWGGTACHPPRDLADFADFVRELARRYRGRIHAYECWNEPDTGHFVGTAQQYVDLLATMRRVLREEDPTAIVVGGVGSGYARWTDTIAGLGAAPLMDALAIHPYCMVDPAMDLCTGGGLGRFVAELGGLRARLGHDLPVWGDELGTTFSPLTRDAFVAQYGGDTATPGGVITTYAAQSTRWDVGMMLALVGLGDRSKCFPGGTNNAHHDRKSIAYAAFAQAVSFRTATRLLPVDDGAFGVLIERDPGATRMAGPVVTPRRIAALYGTGSAVFAVAAARVDGMDMDGNPLSFATEDGLLRLDLTGDVVYLFDVPESFAAIPVAAIALPARSTAGQVVAAELSLTNPYPHPETLRLEVSPPAGWTVEPPQPSVTLAGGATSTIAMPIRTGAATGDAAIAFTVIDEDGHRFTARRTLFNLAILPLGRVPAAVDPAVEATWRDAPPLASVDSLEHVALGRPDAQFPDAPHWLGPEDLSYRIRGGWREDGVYLWIDVTDDRVHPGIATDAPWNHDAVELFVDLLNGDQVTGQRTNTEQFVVVPSLGDAFAPCAIRRCNDGTNARAQFWGRRTDHGYLVAGRLSYRAYSRLRPGSVIGLDVKVDDCDDPAAPEQRKASMAWLGDERDTGSDARWGRFVLTGPEAPMTPPVGDGDFLPRVQRIVVAGQTLYDGDQPDATARTIAVDAGQPVAVTCSFVNTGAGPAEDPFTVFVHAVDGDVVHGADAVSETPTTAWQTGQAVTASAALDLGAVRGREVALFVGLYRGADRVSVTNAGVDDQQRLLVGRLRVADQR